MKFSLKKTILTFLFTAIICQYTAIFAQSINIPKFKNLPPTVPSQASNNAFETKFPSTIQEYNSLETGEKETYTTPWNMPQFDSQIEILKDSTLNITETITADFSLDNSIHRGIYRYIPLQYQDRFKNNLNLRFDLIKITDEKGAPYPYQQKFENGNVMLKIGDPEKSFNEPKTYIINYKIQRAINYFEEHDELYWNVTGNDGKVDIITSKATVILPENFDKEQLQLACYTGFGYSKDQNCQKTVRSDLSNKDSNKTFIEFKNNDVLTPGEGITIVVGFPKSIITPPSTLQSLTWFLLDNWGYTLPLITFFICFLIWYKKGRDPKALKATIMPEYEPPHNLTPAEIGTLIDQKVDINDITSTIIDLAVKGYLIIHEKKKKNFLIDSLDYEFEKTTPKSDKVNPLKPHEQIVYDGIFGATTKVELSDLKNIFYKNIPNIENKLYTELTKDGYFSRNPRELRESFYVIGSIFFFGLFFIIMASSLPSLQNLSIYIGVVISALMIIGFGRFMPKFTQKGADTKIHILGLEEFIKTAESDRLKFYEKENIFEKILPYAIALNMGEKWSKACEGLAKNPPNWYTSSNPNFMHHFNSYAFLSSINHLNTNMSSTLSSAPRSSASSGSSGFSSGGFSGGGFGGGGSGGW